MTLAILQHKPVVKNFKCQWKALNDRKEEDLVKVSKVSKTLPIIHWVEAFADHLSNRIGTRMIPLSHIIREREVPPLPLLVETGKLHST